MPKLLLPPLIFAKSNNLVAQEEDGENMTLLCILATFASCTDKKGFILSN